jgi:hypothetical protein
MKPRGGMPVQNKVSEPDNETDQNLAHKTTRTIDGMKPKQGLSAQNKATIALLKPK